MLNSTIKTNLAAAIRRAPSKRYLAYLRSPVWSRIRREHLERCNYGCEICHLRKAIQCHHWTYVRLGYELPQDLCALCVWCHHDVHCLVSPAAANDNRQLSLFDTKIA